MTKAFRSIETMGLKIPNVSHYLVGTAIGLVSLPFFPAVTLVLSTAMTASLAVEIFRDECCNKGKNEDAKSL